LRRHIERPAISVAPREIVWMFRADDRSEVFSSRAQNPESTRAGHVHVSMLIDFQPVDRVLSRRARHVEEHFEEIQRRRTDPDEVRGRIGDRTVDPEDGELNSLTWLCVLLETSAREREASAERPPLRNQERPQHPRLDRQRTFEELMFLDGGRVTAETRGDIHGPPMYLVSATGDFLRGRP
jgi:hypothetical protein